MYLYPYRSHLETQDFVRSKDRNEGLLPKGHPVLSLWVKVRNQIPEFFFLGGGRG